MGHKQKVILVCSMFVISYAILTGIRQFISSSTNADLDTLTFDLLYIANKAQQYYNKPRFLSGGGHSFTGLTADQAGIRKLIVKPHNENGTFKIVMPGDNQSLTILGIGKYDNDGDVQNMTIEMIVYSNSVKTTIISL
ncbi:MAG: hypothetical protein JSW07_14065 [bacterium]|nr:MAG: hypothetical protein JSW07_14065 [bacterium]